MAERTVTEPKRPVKPDSTVESAPKTLVPGPNNCQKVADTTKQLPKRVTIEALLDCWQRNGQRQARDVVELGRSIDRFLRGRISGKTEPTARRSARAAAVKELQQKLLDQGLKGEAPQVSRYLSCYHAARLLGLKTARELPVGILRAFGPLVQRGPDGWFLRPETAKQAAKLWNNCQKLSLAQVVAAVDRLRPRRTRPTITGKPKVSRVLALIAEITSRPSLCEIVEAIKARALELPAGKPTSNRAGKLPAGNSSSMGKLVETTGPTKPAELPAGKSQTSAKAA